MQRVLVTGATGFVGRHLVKRLCEGTQAHVRIFVRNRAKAGMFDGLPVEIMIGDLASSAQVMAASEGAEVIYHLGATSEGCWEEHVQGTIRGTTHVVEAALQRPGARLVCASSIAVYGIPRRPQNPLTEETPYADGDVTAYARAKIKAEQIVREAVARRGLAATILRLGNIYGPGSSVNMSRIGCRVGNMFFKVGMRDITLPLIYVGNVVEALLLAGRSAHGCGQIYHVVDDARLTQTSYIRQLNTVGPIRYGYVFVPCALAVTIGWIARRLGRYHRTLAGIGATLSPLHVRSCATELIFDTSKIQRDLGWQPAVDSEAYIRRTCEADAELVRT